MGVSNFLYDYGFQYEDPKKPYAMDGFVNSAGAVKGLEAYKELYKCCTPPGASNAYMSEGLDAFKSGQVAMQMNFFAFFPGLYKDPNVGGDKIGFFVNPAGPAGQATQLGGQGISVVSYSENQDEALQYIKWFAGRRRAEEVVGARRLFLRQVGAERPELPGQRAVRARTSCSRWAWSRTSGPSPPTPSCCRPSRSASMTTSWPTRAPRKEALDGLVKDWKAVFKEEGKKF